MDSIVLIVILSWMVLIFVPWAYNLYTRIKLSNNYPSKETLESIIRNNIHRQIKLGYVLLFLCFLGEVFFLLFENVLGVYLFPAIINILIIVMLHRITNHHIESQKIGPYKNMIYARVIKDMKTDPEIWWKNANNLLDSLKNGKLTYADIELLPLIAAMKYYDHMWDVKLKLTFKIPKSFKKHPHFKQFKNHVRNNIDIFLVIESFSVMNNPK